MYVIGWKKYKTQFQGIEVSMKVRPLKRKAMRALMPIMKMGTLVEVKGKKKIQYTSEEILNLGYDMHELSRDILPDHVKDLESEEEIIVDEHPVTVMDICDESIFLLMAQDIMNHLIEISQLGEEDSKNLQGQSENSLPDIAENA